jgi:uncharacterized protein with NRDE domain
MCVLAFAWAAHPRWRLVLAGNRDEYHARPAAPLARWAEPYPLIAGRDLASGGTWLGVSETGRLAVVTNLRGHGPPDPGKASRGQLVTDLLAGTGRYADPQPAALVDFNPFNLIVVDTGQASFITNRPDPQRSRLAQGLYGLSNGRLDEPWPKTMRLKAALLGWLTADEGDPEGLFAALRETGVPPVGAPPEVPSDVPQEPPLSSIFIEHPVYGTRCSTVVLVDAEGRGLIAERRFAPDGSATGDTRIDFRFG